MLFILLLSLINSLQVINTTSLPVVLMHGLLSNVEKMNELKLFLTTNFSLTVIVPEIGNGSPNSLFLPLSIQGEMLCNELQTFTILKDGFNFIGVSQGGLLGRYYIEKCNPYNGYQINNFITMVTPHGGVYNKAYSLINMYSPYNMEHYSFTAYWRDPYNYNTYLNVTLLADLNNENINNNINNNINKNKFSSIKNFIMVYSLVDKIVLPPESGKFSTYKKDTMEIIPLEETISYYNLGLNKFMDENRLHVYTTNCAHDEHIDYKCFSTLYNMFQKFCL